MKQLILPLMIFSLLVGGFCLQTEIAGLNMTDWNFTGNEIMRGVTPYSGGFLMLIGVALTFLWGMERRKSD